MNIQSKEWSFFMPKKAEQFAEMRDKSKAVIQAAALKLFSKQGFHGTTIQQISKEAKIATGLVYNYYASKEALMHEIMKTRMSNLVEVLNQNKKEILSKPNIYESMQLIFNYCRTETEFWQLMIQISLQLDSEKDNHSNDKRHAGFFYQFLVEILTELYRKEKTKNAGQKAEETAYLLHGAFLSYLVTLDEKLFLELVKLILKN
jgi:AcrR family transcriptional regulator